MATSTHPRTYGLLCFAKGATGWVARAAAGPAPALPVAPELHLNIWERAPTKGTPAPDAFLDVGIMLDVNDPTTSLELVFPTKVESGTVQDLAAVVSDPKAVPAVFNESWAVASLGTHGADAVVYDPAGLSRSFAIVSTQGAITEVQHAGHDALSIAIQPLIARAKSLSQSHQKNVASVYLRFRILAIKPDFYAVGAGSHNDDWWMPSWQRTEDIDFRLNVRRGAPPGLESTVGRFVEFSKVHLFLMRSRDKDIVFLDKLFKASRSLEDEEFWAQYSLTSGQTMSENRLRVKNSLGYQWSKFADPEPVREFGTLARFKVVEFGIGKFIAVALLVGAAGNMLWDAAKAGYGLITAPVIVMGSADNESEKNSAAFLPASAATSRSPGVQPGTKKESK